jgi:hypothetical protein
MKLTIKSVIPLFLALIFVGSIFVVFTGKGGQTTGTAQITVDYSILYGTKQKDVQLWGNATAFDLLNGYANFRAESGQVRCITYPPKAELKSISNELCGNNKTSWKFYVNDVVSTENAEHYVVQNGDKIKFSYQEIKKTAVNESTINETI